MLVKKDGTLKLCADYRCLNSLTVQDAYLTPQIEDSLAALVCAQYLSELDLTSGYWQVPISAEDQEKMGFFTPMELYEFL